MFNNLVESTVNAKENKKQSTYFGLTTVFYAAFCTFVLVWSIFSFDVSALNGDSDLTLETLVAPAALPEKEIPLPPKEVQQPKTNIVKEAPQNYDLIRNPVKNINNSTEPPKGVTTNRVDVNQVREHIPFKVADNTKLAEISGEVGRSSGREVALNIPEFAGKTKAIVDEEEKSPPPVVKKTEPPVHKNVPVVSKGVINGIAVNLPKPAYPAMAKAVNASGAVQVQVTIDEQGNVISAAAVGGHPLLKAAAVDAAKRARFTPTKLSDQAVKVTGIIVYNFVP